MLELLLKRLLGLGEKGLEGALSQKAQARAEQARLNEEEISGAPVSRLRLWRSFLGWALSLAFCWEVARAFIVHYLPDASVPPSMLREITGLLFGMLGL